MRFVSSNVRETYRMNETFVKRTENKRVPMREREHAKDQGASIHNSRIVYINYVTRYTTHTYIHNK